MFRFQGETQGFQDRIGVSEEGNVSRVQRTWIRALAIHCRRFPTD